MLFIIWLGVIVAFLVFYLSQAYSRFDRYGVKYFKPIPFIGNLWRILLRLCHFSDDIAMLYNAFPEERFVGRYEFTRPRVLLRDTELIKRITVKDFEYFLDHQSLVDDKTDPFFGRNLFSLKGQEWKDMRSTLSPAFTSSKIRLMVPFMVEVGDIMLKSLKEKLQDSEGNFIDIDCKDLAARYANDVIATCAFGLKVDSHTDRDNTFYKMGKTTSNFHFVQIIKLLFIGCFPELSKYFRLSLFAKSTKNFFWDLVTSTMNDREVKRIVRPDMIHLLMEAKKGKLTHEDKGVPDIDAGFATVEESSVGKKSVNRELTDLDLVAQALVFFVAGFETMSSAISIALYELAMHPDVQDRLVEEIKENEAKNGGKIDYTSIQNLKYLDMVVSEVLRKWPPAVAFDRLCVKDYNLGKPNKESLHDFVVHKRESVMIPVWAIHRDPNFYTDPDKFDPERFSEENKALIKPFTYVPFGLGPRNCIGSRFALCEVKVMLYQLLLHMELSPCEKTNLKGELSTDNFNIRLKGGDWLRFRSRQVTS